MYMKMGGVEEEGGLLRLYAKMVSTYCVELKREAAARSEVRDKVKEEQPSADTEVKEPEEQQNNKTPLKATDIKQEH